MSSLSTAEMRNLGQNDRNDGTSITGHDATTSPRNGEIDASQNNSSDDNTSSGSTGENINTNAQQTKESVPQRFRMKFQVGSIPRRKRKRDVVGNPKNSSKNNSSLLPRSSSSSSSSDEDELETRLASRSIAFVVEGHRNHGGGSVSRERGAPQRPDEEESGGGREDSIEDRGLSLSGSTMEQETVDHGDGETDVVGTSSSSSSSVVSSSVSQKQSEGWRVKLYRLTADGSWDDCGTGSILCLYKKNASKASSLGQSSPTGDAWVYHELCEPTLCMHSEVKNQSTGESISPPKILLRTRILLRDAYQRQGDNIITWCEPYLEEGNPTHGVDLALSFQDVTGCLNIWRQITQVQLRAAELFRKNGSKNSNADGIRSQSSHSRGDAGTESFFEVNESDVDRDMAYTPSAAHDGKQKHEAWVNSSSDTSQHHLDQQNSHTERNRDHHFDEESLLHSYHAGGPMLGFSNAPQSPQLPNPPGIANLEEIADSIAAVQSMQQSESLAMFISQHECSYLKSMLSLFPSAESRGDYGSLVALAACVKSILLLNDPSIIEFIVSDELIFEEVCSALEYDRSLRDKANHRWFLRERAKFRTVALMEDEELVASIHRSFRVKYLRDTVLRPTMDESSLSTLSSLLTFTHADVVKGVTASPLGTAGKGELNVSYLAKIIRILGRDSEAICDLEWKELEDVLPDGDIDGLLREQAREPETDLSTVVATGRYPQSQDLSTVWKQYLAPQDDSLPSRRLRRRGCLSFLRELFNMVRLSLQQSEKDDFFAVLVPMEVDLDYETDKSNITSESEESRLVGEFVDSGSSTKSEQGLDRSGFGQSRTVNLLSLLGTILADPKIDLSEKGSALEIISGIVMHDPGLLRQRCLDSFVAAKREKRKVEKYFDPMGPARPHANEKGQVILYFPPNDLLGSLMFILASETDSGVLLQVLEILKAILDNDMITDHGPMGVGFFDEIEGIPPGTIHSEHHSAALGSPTTSSEQNQFLSMFYDHYVQWLAVPFQHKVLVPISRIPKLTLEFPGDSLTLQKLVERFEKGPLHEEHLLRPVARDAVRSSIAVEMLSFCVRHLYRMKCYLLRSRVIGNVLKVLTNPGALQSSSGERCLTLAALRFLRTILSVKDEFYHRHIIQHDLFDPVFAAFRSNPIGDNLVSSAIVEMCDFVQKENIKSLLEYIVTKHLSASSDTPIPSLEDVSSPYVTTLKTLRLAYENNLKITSEPSSVNSTSEQLVHGDEEARPGYSHGETHVRSAPRPMNEKAREDQRKFREMDHEESYFDADDDDIPTMNATVPPGVDEVPS